MLSCEVLSTLKLGGVRYPPGTVLDLTDEQVAGLPPGVVRVEHPPLPAPALARSEKTAEERAEAVRVAQRRVAVATTR